MTINSGVYQIRCLVTGKVYVGSSGTLHRRWRLHRRDLNAGRHSSRRLQNAWSKYGKDAFVFEILELVDDLSLLIQREQYYIDAARSAEPKIGYNISPTAGSCRGVKRSVETRVKLTSLLRTAEMDQKRLMALRSPEVRARLSETAQGRRHTAETIAKLSEKARNRSPETLAKMSEAKRNISPETRERLSVAAQNHSPEHRAKFLTAAHTPETRAKIVVRLRTPELRRALADRNGTPEHRAKVSAAKRGKKASPETRAKLSKAARNRPPEHLAKLLAAARNPTLETRAKISAAAKQRVRPPRDPRLVERVHELISDGMTRADVATIVKTSLSTVGRILEGCKIETHPIPVIDDGGVRYQLVPSWPGYRVGEDETIWSCRNGHGGYRNSWKQLTVYRHPVTGVTSVTLCVDGQKRVATTRRLLTEAFGDTGMTA
jgi:group I intron endonuclease